MITLTFYVTGTELIRTDMNKLVAVSRNNVAARFEFNSDWEGITPLVAQFSKDENTCYDVFIENGECIVPWEVLENEGILTITVFGGDLITTSSVNINVYGNGLVGGLVPTVASPSVYSEVVRLSGEIEADWNNCKELLANYETTITESQNTIADLTAKIEADFEKVNVELQESKDNVDKATKLLADIEYAMSEAISAIDVEKESAVTQFNNNADNVKAEVIADIDTVKNNSISEINTVVDNAKADIDVSVQAAADSAAEAKRAAESIQDAVTQVEQNTNDIAKLTQNAKCYEAIDAIEYFVDTNADITITNPYCRILDDKWTNGNSNVYLILNFLMRHDNTNTVKVAFGYLSQFQYNNTQPDTTKTIIQQPGNVPPGDEYTELTMKAVFKNIDLSVLHRVGIKMSNIATTENGKIGVDFKGVKCTVIPFDEDIDTEAIDYFLTDNSNSVVVPLLWDKVKQLEEAIISMGGNI